MTKSKGLENEPSFRCAQQGSVHVFALPALVCVRTMNRPDGEFGLAPERLRRP